jgi:hypothetical protein
MKHLITVICILLLSAGTGQSEDLIFFADDQYKSLGRPELAASAANPVLASGSDCTLQINLANFGKPEELIPINKSSSSQDLSREVKEEMQSSNALNINAVLADAGPIAVKTGAQHISLLRAGDCARLQFDISAKESANGWYALPFSVDYERQADVSVRGGEVVSLYEAERQNMTAQIFVAGDKELLDISAIKSALYTGGKENLWAAISNNRDTTLHNCSARLLAAPPFHSEGPDAFLGDIAPASAAIACFLVRVDGDAGLGNYQLGCEINCEEKSIILPLPFYLSRSRGLLGSWGLPALGGLFIAGLAVFLLRKKGDLIIPRKRRWG